MRTYSIVLLSALLCVPIATRAQSPRQADVQLVSSNPHLKPGSELVFKVRLNEPLPVGARFDVRLSPVGINQELAVSSAEPDDKDRKDFTLQAKLPDNAWAGQWHIAIIWLFLPGSSWTTSSLTTNDMRFIVDGVTKPLPTNATATIVSK